MILERAQKICDFEVHCRGRKRFWLRLQYSVLPINLFGHANQRASYEEEALMQSHCLRRYLLLAIFAATALGMGPGAQAQTWVQAGMLKCRLNPTIGFVIFGHQSMECSFQPVSGPAQAYEGAINTVGLDLGFTEGGILAWGSLDQQVGCLTARSLESTSGLPAKLVSGPG